MFFLGCVYRIAQSYNFVRQVGDALYKPAQSLRNKLLDGNAIQRAAIIDINRFGDDKSEAVIYEWGRLELLYNLYLMWFVFGADAWMERGVKANGRFKIDDPRLGRDGVYLHVKLGDGREFLTSSAFDSDELSYFYPPKRKYLCVMMNDQDVTRLYKRFVTSWNSLNLSVIDFVLIAMHLDTKVYHYITSTQHSKDISIVTIDDDTVEENEYKDHTRLSF